MHILTKVRDIGTEFSWNFHPKIRQGASLEVQSCRLVIVSIIKNIGKVNESLSICEQPRQIKKTNFNLSFSPLLFFDFLVF